MVASKKLTPERLAEIMNKNPLELEHLFGLWKNRDGELSPCEIVRRSREGRVF